MAKRIEIPYGYKSLVIHLPSSWQFLGQFSPPEINSSKSPTHLLWEALENLIGVSKFDIITRNKKKVVIISDDTSRPTPTSVIIPPLLDRLNAAGIPDAQIEIVVGRGLHPTLSERDLKEKFGSEVLTRVKVLNHDPNNNLTYIGETAFGTKVHINSEVVQADLKIGLGSILPHELAGYTGGSGIVIPGVAGRETINQNHCLIGTFEAEFGKLEGNTIREDMDEAAKLLGLDLIINAILTSTNKIIKVIAGDPIAAHRRGVSFAKECYGVKIPKRADIVIASSFPYDATFGKAMKALFASNLAVKEDGVIILLAPCTEGLSSSSLFQDMLLQNPTPDLLFEQIDKGELPGESCVLYLFSKLKERRIIVVTEGLSQAEVEQMGLEFAPSLEQAIKRITIHNPEVIILPKGAITLPLL